MSMSVKQAAEKWGISDKRIRVLCSEGNTLTLGIHPFIDGNGRAGRLLVNLELMKAGFPSINIKFTDRMAYYNAFDEYHVKHNLSAMEKLFAGE